MIPDARPGDVTSEPTSKNCNCTCSNTSPHDERPNSSKNNTTCEPYDCIDSCPFHCAVRRTTCSPFDYTTMPPKPIEPVHPFQIPSDNQFSLHVPSLASCESSHKPILFSDDNGVHVVALAFPCVGEFAFRRTLQESPCHTVAIRRSLSIAET